MADFLSLAPAVLAGGLLGGFFFGGLWWTLRKGLTSQSPALWFLAGMMLRMSITLAGFYFVGDEDWRRWLSCLFGFVVARQIVSRLTRTPADQQKFPVPAISHAP
jgi:F1F0 ATPase subunit 2